MTEVSVVVEVTVEIVVVGVVAVVVVVDVAVLVVVEVSVVVEVTVKVLVVRRVVVVAAVVDVAVLVVVVVVSVAVVVVGRDDGDVEVDLNFVEIVRVVIVALLVAVVLVVVVVSVSVVVVGGSQHTSFNVSRCVPHSRWLWPSTVKADARSLQSTVRHELPLSSHSRMVLYIDPVHSHWPLALSASSSCPDPETWSPSCSKQVHLRTRSGLNTWLATAHLNFDDGE